MVEEQDLDIYYQYSPYFAETEKEQEATRKIFLFKLAKLPPKLRAILVAPETAQSIATLVQRQGMTPEQGATLARLIRRFAIGDIFLRDLSIAIATQLRVPALRAAEIANTVLNSIFGSVLAEIKAVQRESFPDRLVGNALRSTPAPTNPTPRPRTIVTPSQPIKSAVNRNNVVDLRKQN